MSPEEQAVVDAAVAWRKTIHYVIRYKVISPPGSSISFGTPQPHLVALLDAVDALTPDDESS